MEEAEHAFYRSLGTAAFERTDSGFVGMPRVAANLTFVGPVRYGDEVDVRITLREKRPKVLRYDAEITRVGGDMVAHGSMTVVCARRDHGDPDWRGTELSETLLELLEPVPEDEPTD